MNLYYDLDGTYANQYCILGCSCPTIFCSRTQVPRHYDKVEEARYSIICLHGDFKRVTVYDGLC